MTEVDRLMHHILKTDPQVFDAMASGAKTYEIRYNDRGYKVGNIIHLRRTRWTGKQMNEHGMPLEYSKVPEIVKRVTHVLENQYGVQQGWAILSLGEYRDERIY